MSQPALKISDNKNTASNGGSPLVEVRGLKKYFPIHAGFFGRMVGSVRAVDGVSFAIQRGKTLGLVGESGCGKTTVGKTILRLTDITDGEVTFDGESVHALSRKELQPLRSRMQIIFQDPYSSLSPRLPIGEIIAEAVREHGIVPRAEINSYVTKVMRSCELQAYHKDRYPHEFSGGQRQRICIARALALNPDFIVCDEPVSALDVSIQAQIINLLADLQQKYGMAYLFISHDLSVVEHIADAVGVMYLGQLVEYGECREIFRNPLHPYTKALFSAIPIPDPTVRRERIILEGSLPSPAQSFEGCRFQSRCKERMPRCQTEKPSERGVGGEHRIICHLYD
ncbi:MAG: ATP-binding cassette domain-containing protein [Oscillospiraceae bacterium]|jgi:peptide/nickel transport system ATP-binding protein|nr:ATP-binding cassette domain-containing protein [Oscillospiraceae bacterium]